MLRSPISPASFCTSAASSPRKTISSAESCAAVEIFFPGILIPTHQSKKKNARTASVMRRPLRKTRRNRPKLSRFKLSNLLPKPKGADAEKEHGHDRQDGERRPILQKGGAAENDGAHQRNEISRREKRADRVEA